VVGVEVLAHRGNLPVAEGDEEMVLLPVLAAVSQIAARLDLDCDAVALCCR
jgi:hypothetical protein